MQNRQGIKQLIALASVVLLTLFMCAGQCFAADPHTPSHSGAGDMSHYHGPGNMSLGHHTGDSQICSFCPVDRTACGMENLATRTSVNEVLPGGPAVTMPVPGEVAERPTVPLFHDGNRSIRDIISSIRVAFLPIYLNNLSLLC